MIMITHDIEFVAELKPRVILMHGGKLIADGPAAKILTDPTLVDSSSLTLPQLTQVLAGFDGMKHEILDLEEAVSLIRQANGAAS